MLREEVRRVLVDAAEPRLVRRQLRRPAPLQPRLVGDRQRHDQADLVDQHQPIDARRSRRRSENAVADRHQEAEQQERDEDRQQREGRADLAPPAGCFQMSGRNFMRPPPCSTPFSRCSVRVARSAACGSCVTMTIVLPCSRLSACSRSRISSPALRSRSPVGSSHSSSVGIGDDGAGDADALLLAARELPRIVLGAVGEADDLQRDADALLPLAPSTGSSAAAAARRCARRSAPAAGCRAGRRSRCAASASARAGRRAERADVDAADLDRAARRRVEAADQVRAASSCPSPTAPSARGSRPAGISRFTPFSTSMRSLPRVKCLWTSLTWTSAFSDGIAF